MREVVLDSSVVLKWIADEPGSAEARTLIEEQVVIPSLCFLEVLNVAARSWRWPEGELRELVRTLEDAGFEVADPPLDAVAVWAARGLTAYDGAYVAVAEQRAIPLVTTDAQILDVARDVAEPLAV